MIAPEHPSLDLSFVDQAVERLGRRPEAVIPILQAIQSHYRYLPEPALERVCRLTEITPSQITGVSTFYTQFRHRPVGRHIVSVCHGTACHVKGSELIQDALQHRLKLSNGEDTDRDGLFTVQKVACLGCCTLAPVLQIDGVTYGRLTPSMVPDVLGEFLQRESENGSGASVGNALRGVPGVGKKPIPALAPERHGGRSLQDLQIAEIRIGLGSCCVAQGSDKVHASICRVLERTGAAAVVKRVGCVGMCHQTPLVEIVSAQGASKLFARVAAEDVPAIVAANFRPRGIVRRIGQGAARMLDWLLTDEVEDPLLRHAIDVRDPPVCAFLGPQRRLVTEFCGQTDPTDLDEYLRHDGFLALRRCIEELSPESLIAEMTASGARGRGGAGFPTGTKWSRVRDAEGDPKYIICNGDEGDPGAFMDRMLLESFPYRVIEGLAIAARAVGARQGYFYIRAEYPLAVQRIREALKRCQERGILGDRVLGVGGPLHLEIKEGAGAFVCGEETALLASIQGQRGMPRLRPPYPADCGLWGKPTLINNVETYALAPWIFLHGAKAFAALGTEKSKGTKVFALAGKVRRGGLIEVPMGVTLRAIVEEIGGGVPEGHRFKAVQVGGPSGGCVPAELADTPVDYEALTAAGAIMGSGGLVVMDDSDCMVDIARYFLRFTQDQSCGKCTFCRIGTRRMLDILDRICAGHGHRDDLAELEQLSLAVSAGSICGLGKTAPNPVLSTLKYFRHEYEAHLAGRCPAGKCRELIHYRIDDRCIGCTLCAQNCPVGAIPLSPYARHAIDQQACTRCDTCRQVCPTGAVVVE
jgi:NADH-quinone oxidoreductase subunit F